MDKKAPTSLDPKLKEAYDRVMGFTPPPTAAAPKPAAPAVQPVTPPPAPQMPTAKVVNAAPARPTTYEVNEIPSPHLPPKQIIDETQQTKQSDKHSLANEEENSSPLKPILYSIGGGVFFLVYAYVWAKILNISLPF